MNRKCFTLKACAIITSCFAILSIQAKKVEVHGDLKLIADNKNNIYVQSKFFSIPLNSGKKHLFRFTDKTKKAPLLLSTWIWYHGRSAAKDVFYQAHNETHWPLEKIKWEWSKDLKTLTVHLKSSNSDWFVTRKVSVYSDKPYVKLRYTLKAKEYFPRDNLVAPLMDLLGDFTSVSYNIKDKFSPIVPIKEISGMRLNNPATIIQFFAPKYQRTLSIINNANLAVKNGFETPAYFLCRDLKKLKRLHLNNNSLPPNYYLKKGQTMETELLFFLQDGAKPNAANQKDACKLAEKFNFLPTPESLKFPLTTLRQTKTSPLARLIRADGTCEIWYESPLKKVYPEMSKPLTKSQKIKIFSARNEKESFQLVIKPKTDIRLSKVIISDFKDGEKLLGRENIKGYFLEYQKKETISGLYGLSNLVADKLINFKNALSHKFSANKAQPLWFTINVPSNTEAGLYNGQVTLKFSDKNVVKVPVSLRIWNFALPKKSPYRAVGTIGWSSPKSKRMAYIKKMSEYHISGNLLPGDSRTKLQLFDGKRIYLDEFIKRAKIASEQYNNNAILLPNTFLSNCSWRPGKRVSFRNMDPTTKEFENAYRSYLEQCSKLLQKNGLDKDIILKVWDEIPTAGYPIFKKAVKIIRQVNPEFKIEYVGAPDKENVELADIICPGAFSSWWGKRADNLLKKYNKQGKEFWIYLNNLTFHLNQEAVITRLVPWMCWTRGIKGYYQWGMDAGWKSNFNSQGHVWLFYPSKDEPIPSVRLEYFRDGIEDYTYFELLKNRSNAKELLEKCFEISPKFAPLDMDIVKVHNLRLKMGKLLDK